MPGPDSARFLAALEGCDFDDQRRRAVGIFLGADGELVEAKTSVMPASMKAKRASILSGVTGAPVWKLSHSGTVDLARPVDSQTGVS